MNYKIVRIEHERKQTARYALNLNVAKKDLALLYNSICHKEKCTLSDDGTTLTCNTDDITYRIEPDVYKYSVVTTCTYKHRTITYIEGEFNSIKDAREFMKARCYDTPTRTTRIRMNF